jgi:hypothetical protein
VQVGCLTTQTNTIVHYLAVDFSFRHINERHKCKFSYPLKRASSRMLRLILEGQTVEATVAVALLSVAPD